MLSLVLSLFLCGLPSLQPKRPSSGVSSLSLYCVWNHTLTVECLSMSLHIHIWLYWSGRTSHVSSWCLWWCCQTSFTQCNIQIIILITLYNISYILIYTSFMFTWFHMFINPNNLIRWPQVRVTYLLIIFWPTPSLLSTTETHRKPSPLSNAVWIVSNDPKNPKNTPKAISSLNTLCGYLASYGTHTWMARNCITRSAVSYPYHNRKPHQQW